MNMETAVTPLTIISDEMKIQAGEINYEDFLEKSRRMPDFTGRWLYRYRSYITLQRDETDAFPLIVPIFEEIIFMTLKDAETYMKESVKENGSSLYRYMITQIPIGENILFEGVSKLYDSNGNFIDWYGVNRLGSKFDGVFYGRSDERVRFVEDEIVEVKIDDTVYLGIVYDIPLNVFSAYSILEREGSYYKNQSEDEYCIIVDGIEDPQFIPSIDIMKLSHPYSKEVELRLEKRLDDIYKVSIPPELLEG